MDFVPAMTEEEKEYWEQVLKVMTAEEVEKIKEFPEETPKCFVLGVMRTYPKAKGDKLVRLIAKAIRKHIAWRDAVDIDHFLEREFSKVRTFRDKVWPLRHCGYDPDGLAVVVARLRDCDWGTANKVITDKQELLEYFTLNVELQKLYLKGIKRPNRTNLVFDFKGMRWGDYKQAWRMGISSLFGQLADHNPESTKTIALVNAPSFFGICYAALKPLLPQDTVKKISILSSNPETIKKHFAAKGFESLESYPTLDGRYVISDALVEFQEGEKALDASEYVSHIQALMLKD